MNTIEEIAHIELKLFSERDLFSFSSMNREDLIGLHHDYGMYLRNKLGLWHNHSLTENWRTNENLRNIDAGVDCSKDHPDRVSKDIIESMWKISNSIEFSIH